MRVRTTLLLTTAALLALPVMFDLPGSAESALEATGGSAARDTDLVAEGPPEGEVSPSGDPRTGEDEDEQGAAPVLALQADLLRFITSLRGGRWGVLVVSMDRGDTLFAYRADAPLTPASNLKLFTTAAALHYLGPGYRYATWLLSSAPIEDGVLDGDLHLYGTGDPSISGIFHDDDRAPWRALADTLAARGIREIRGDIVGDASWFESPSVPRGWQDRYRSADYAAPASALAYHENTVSLRVLPGEEAGWRPRVHLIPGGRGISIVNLATTTSGGRSRLDVDRLAYDGPIVIEGRIPRGHSAIWREVPVADPARYAAAIFREALAARGIGLRGGIRSVNEPARSILGERRVFAPAFQEARAPRVLASHVSPPLQDILTVINHESHNQFAEQVLRTMGRVVEGDGTAAGGAGAVYAFLEDVAGVQVEGSVRIYDGSGLSVLNKVTPAAVLGLLSHMATSSQREAYQATLPVAGTRRGLRRMYDSPAQDNLRAKTGTIEHVSALSGYVTASNGETLGFSIIANDLRSTWAAKGVENRIGVQLASFTRPAAGSKEERLAAAPEREGVEPPSEEPAPGEDVAPESEAPAPDTPREHTIRPGDTLDGIGKKYGVSVSALREANPGINPRRLIPGRSVRVPAGM